MDLETYPDKSLILPIFEILLSGLSIRTCDDSFDGGLSSVCLAEGREWNSFGRIRVYSGCLKLSERCHSLRVSLLFDLADIVVWSELAHLVGLDDLRIDTCLIQLLIIFLRGALLFDLGQVPRRSQFADSILLLLILHTVSMSILRQIVSCWLCSTNIITRE